eukprot:gene8287-5806_t
MSGGSCLPPYYAVLGVPVDVTPADLARHYRQLSLAHHPDRAAYHQQRGAAALGKFQEITAAYKVLSDPQRRAAYDVQYGVNFQARAATIHETIQRRNDLSSKRARSPAAKQEKSDGGHSASGEESDESYTPSEGEPRRQPRAEPTFTLVPVPQVAGTAEQQWRGVTLRRPRGAMSWGLELSNEGNFTLVHCDGPAAGRVPVPSVIVQVNHRSVGRYDDLGALLNPAAPPPPLSGEGGSRLRIYMGSDSSCAAHPAAVFSTEALMGADEPPPPPQQPPSASVAEEEELSLGITFCSTTYRLVGDLGALCDRKRSEAERLVPDPARAELSVPHHTLSRSVLSVNGIEVESGEELRRVLMEEAEKALSDAGRAASTGLLVEMCTVDGLPPCLA